MPYFKTSDGVSLFYNDWGNGRPVVLIHRWPLSSDFWEPQSTFLAANGYRVIVYDRRGFGRSDQPWTGYDYDSLADDLDALMRHLDLRDATLVGFSMGGGEVARYVSRHGTGRVAQSVLMSAVTPSLKKTDANPEGIEQAVFDGLLAALESDRHGFLADFREGFFNGRSPDPVVSQGVLDWYSFLASHASQRATIECSRYGAPGRRSRAHLSRPVLERTFASRCAVRRSEAPHYAALYAQPGAVPGLRKGCSGQPGIPCAR